MPHDGRKDDTRAHPHPHKKPNVPWTLNADTC
jgi:hypothetical protein